MKNINVNKRHTNIHQSFWDFLNQTSVSSKPPMATQQSRSNRRSGASSSKAGRVGAGSGAEYGAPWGDQGRKSSRPIASMALSVVKVNSHHPPVVSGIVLATSSRFISNCQVWSQVSSGFVSFGLLRLTRLLVFFSGMAVDSDLFFGLQKKWFFVFVLEQ